MAEPKILQDDEDFLVEVINWQGKPAVKKSIQPTTHSERVNRLQNEAHGLKFFADLLDKNREINLYAPKLFEVAEDHIVSEYINRPTLGDKLENLELLAVELAKIDRIEPFGGSKIKPNFDYRNIRDRFPIWIEQAKKAGMLNTQQINRANKILDSLHRYIKPRIAHGDLSPYVHAFMMNEAKIALVDWEVFTPHGARYYDIARCYTRLYERAASTETPKKFLEKFLSHADEVEHQEEQLLAIILQRTIGMQRDAAVDYRKGDDYRERARELLDLVLQAKLGLLYS